MRIGAFWIIVFAIGLPSLDASDLAGTWEGNLAVGTEKLHAGFDLDVTGNRITGGALQSQSTDPVSIDASPKELQGKWAARFVGRIGDRPKMIDEIV